MFATLNLQFSTAEITTDALATSVMMPQSAPSGGFAELLRLRTDTAMLDSGDPGDWLPPGGTQLPLQPMPLELEALPGLETGDFPMPAIEPAPGAETTDLALNPPLQNPLATRADTRVLSGLAETMPAPVVAAPERPLRATQTTDPTGALGVKVARDVPSGPAVTSLPTVAETTPRPLPVVPLGEVEARISESVLPPTRAPREPLLPAQPQPLPTVIAGKPDQIVPRLELPPRVEPLSPTITSSEDIGEIFRARPIVTQPVQVLNSQPNPQQPLIVAPPTPGVTADTGYLAAAQQANDAITMPVKDAGWGEHIGERVLMMAGNKVRTAEIRLTPAELGPLRVQVSVDDGAANVTFQAQHAVTREAIEIALPRLRELLAENGLSLGEASVGEQGVDQYKRDEDGGSPQSGSDVDNAVKDGSQDDTGSPRNNVISDSLVDTFV